MEKYMHQIFSIGLPFFFSCSQPKADTALENDTSMDTLTEESQETEEIEETTDTNENPSQPEDDATNTTPVLFTENIHDSLPADWISEYENIKSNLLTLLPVYQRYYDEIVVYAWKDSIEDPYEGVDGGAYISVENGNERVKRFVMEIPELEFTYESFHRYSVIAHEYFHCYQMNLNEFMNRPNDDPEGFDVKWLTEGTAAAFEGIYVQQYYDFSYITYDQNYVDDAVFTDPSKYEAFDTSQNIDQNYGSSLFLVLVLAKELQNQGHSETEAFRLIFQDYMLGQPQNGTWESIFKDTFNLTVADFYSSLSNYTGQDNVDVLPSPNLTLEDIFVED